jgi:hypothetical protein
MTARMKHAGGRPVVRFIFSHEEFVHHRRKYDSFCYDRCPHCGLRLIEVYADRILSQVESRVFFGEGEENGIKMLIWKINCLLLHELTHWAGCSEEHALTAEEIAKEFSFYDGSTGRGMRLPGAM